MPQPKSSGGATRKRASSTGAKSTTKSTAKRASSAGKGAATKAASKSSSAKSTAKRTTSARSGSGAKTGGSTGKAPARRAASSTKSTAKSTAKRATGSAKSGAGSAKSGASSAKTSAKRGAAARDDQLRENLAQLRDVLARAVVLPAERVQAVLDRAKKDAHIDDKGVQEIAGGLVEAGRKQADELRGEIEALIGRGRGQTDDFVSKVNKGARQATKRATKAGDPVLKQVDKVRRRTGLGSFPITGYDELTAAQVKSRLGDLTKADLRKVRTHEKKQGARKSVLDAIEQRLS